MRFALQVLLLSAVVALLPSSLLAPAHAAGTGADNVPPVDPAPCLAAIAAGSEDGIIADCGALIDNDRTARADRIKALIARAGVLAREGQSDRAMADYDAVLRLDPTLADVFNARGELYWKTGDRPRAVADFSAALKLDPNHPAAKDNSRRLALELERQGAMMALAGKPSFNCAAARRPVEKAICANPGLADLDREINAVNAKLLRAASGGSATHELGAISRRPQCLLWQERLRPRESDAHKARRSPVDPAAIAERRMSFGLNRSRIPRKMPQKS